MFEIEIENEVEPIVFLRYRHADGALTTLMVMEPQIILEFGIDLPFEIGTPKDGFLVIKWQADTDSILLEVAMIRKKDKKLIAQQSLEVEKTADNLRTLKDCLQIWRAYFGNSQQ